MLRNLMARLVMALFPGGHRLVRRRALKDWRCLDCGEVFPSAQEARRSVLCEANRWDGRDAQ